MKHGPALVLAVTVNLLSRGYATTTTVATGDAAMVEAERLE